MAYDLTKVPSTRENQSEELPDSFLWIDTGRSSVRFFKVYGNKGKESFVITHTLSRGEELSSRAEDSPLETNTMRNRTQSTRNVKYEHIAIRFVVSSSYVLQGLFYPNETVANLIEFVRTHSRLPATAASGFLPVHISATLGPLEPDETTLGLRFSPCGICLSWPSDRLTTVHSIGTGCSTGDDWWSQSVSDTACFPSDQSNERQWNQASGQCENNSGECQ